MTVGKGLGTSTSTDMESVARVVVAAMVDGGVGVVAAGCTCHYSRPLAVLSAVVLGALGGDPAVNNSTPLCTRGGEETGNSLPATCYRWIAKLTSLDSGYSVQLFS